MSVFLYTGNGSTQTITNGIDLAGKGGLVWTKRRDAAFSNELFDTARGNFGLESNNTGGQWSAGAGAFTTSATGYTWGIVDSALNANGGTYASWTFRKQAKFFDVVTYTGDGTGSKLVSHSLGSAPGCIIVKCTSTTSNWMVWHRSISGQNNLYLNATDGTSTVASDPISVPGFPSSLSTTQFEVSTGTDSCNTNGNTYVAYLFAHDAGGFGQSGSDNVITCGSYTGNGSTTGPVVTLGYEPQWVMIKRATGGTSNWQIVDILRGFTVSGSNQLLYPNLADAEALGTRYAPNATGFQIVNTGTEINANGDTYIYIAIRRGPMKTPTTGTSVYNAIARTGTGSAGFNSTSILSDFVITKARNGVFDPLAYQRLTDDKILYPSRTDAEQSAAALVPAQAWDNMTGVDIGTSNAINSGSYTYVDWAFRRAPGFFDVVCYTGTGSNTTQTHNLGVVPELVIWKRRSTAADWRVWQSSFSVNDGLYLNINLAKDTDSNVQTAIPTATVLNLATGAYTNASGSTYVAYLFATCPGVSKVGSYTGTGNVLQIDCGFTGGARFVLIKRTDSTGDWYVWDSARGIVASTDPYLVLNSTAAEVTSTDWVDTHSPGFELSNAVGNNVNINTASYIFLAIS